MKKVIAICLVLCMVLSFLPVFAADATDFEPFKITVNNTGSAGNKRWVVKTDNFPFEVTEANQLAGCLLNGVVTYNGTEDFSKEVLFKDVVVLKSDVRNGMTAIDFKVPEGFKMDMDNTEDKNYSYDITLSPAKAGTTPAPTTPTPAPTPKPTETEYKLAADKEAVFLKVEDFSENLGTWKITDPANGSILPIFYGKTDNAPDSAQPAKAEFEVKQGGTYSVWARGLDFPNDRPGIRFFAVAIDETEMPEKGGTHGKSGWNWQKLGEISLEAGTHTFSMIDASAFYARCEGFAITNDPNFVGPSAKEIEYVMTGGKKIEINVPTNKLGKAVMLYLGNPKAYVMGKETKVDTTNDAVVPFTENDRTLVPVRFIAESFGATVGWDDATQAVTVKAGNRDLSLVLGQAEMKVNGKTVVLDTPANTYNDRTFIPLRAMVEAMGKKVFWDSRGLIIISDLEFDADVDKDLIDSAVQGFGGEILDFAVVDEDLSGYSGTVGENDYKLDYFNPNEFKERNGMVNTINKLRNGETVVVGFLGGSITQQDGWRGKTLDWIRAQYPKANVVEIDTSLSGTGADLAACRTDREILAHNPDLVFVEYAVNGGTEQNMEGIIRKIWAQDNSTDIILVYTATAGNIPNYSLGRVPTYERGYENVAEHYGVPSVSFAYQIAEYYDAGQITLSGSAEPGKIHFSSDGTHPTMDGSILYAGAVARAIATMDKHTNSGSTRNHELKSPLHADNWENAKMYDYNIGKFEGEWTEYTANGTGYDPSYPYTGGYMTTFQKIFPKMIGTKQPGAKVTVTFTGTSIGVFDLGGTYAGQLKVTIDDNAPITLNRHTPHSSKLRHQYIFTPTLPYGEHTVTFELDSEKPNKTSMSDYQANKAEYDKNEFYFGNFLVVGEVKE
ncbi:MAG: hypothetical protein IJE10_10250 [Clostridia bacterium]|nr:hypothetical protein [Clostridia bacterium]